jgi:hypothetical protein
LAKLARKYLCCPASSSTSERVFSTGGRTVSYKRCKLNPTNVDMLVYIHENTPRVKLGPWNLDLIPENDPEPDGE